MSWPRHVEPGRVKVNLLNNQLIVTARQETEYVNTLKHSGG